MFGLFKKKTQLEKLIFKDGIEHATDRLAEMVAKKLASKDIAYQFIIEELDGASQGNDASKQYAENSGIPREEYVGALSNSNPEIDGPNGPQQFLAALSLELMNDRNLMADFRCKIGDKIMKRFCLGKYSNDDAHEKAVTGKNYTPSKAGFVVEDTSSGDILEVALVGTQFHGRVVTSNQQMTLSLAPWPITENPFEDDWDFNGEGHIKGEAWSFSIRPSASFTEIMNEVLHLNNFKDL